MNISIAKPDEKHLMRNMMQLYLYDFSEFEEIDLNEHGMYEYKCLDAYWKEDGRFPFIIRVEGKLAGFALINKHTYSQEGEFSVAEFFIMRKYRGRSIGKNTAYEIFNLFPGWWEIRQMRNNSKAQSFWYSVIKEYTGNDFSEYPMGFDGWVGPVQTFKSKKKI